MITDTHTEMSTNTNPPRSNQPHDDWDLRYREGDTPWDTGHACSELVRVVDQRWVAPCRAIELGCGTGADAVFLATRSIHVTAVDVSIEAIQQAVARADAARVRVNFCWADVVSLPAALDVPYDFVFDRGCYHCIRKHDVEGYVAALRRITRPGSQFLLLAGRCEVEPQRNESPSQRPGPPRVSQDEIRIELGSLFGFNWIRPFRFDGCDDRPGPSGWSCLMTRVEERRN